jgi:Holliday junction resolvasome RuvABC endonuclease subunit
MNNKYPRILAIAPSTKGFGYAVLEGHRLLVNWGVKTVTGNKNAGAVKKVKEMIAHYNPQVLVLEDTATEGCRRSPRIKALTKRLVEVGESRTINMALFSRTQVKRVILGGGRGTKHAVAESIAEWYPEELGFRLPPKRVDWKSEDSRMAIFDAVALALAYYRSRSVDADTGIQTGN